MEISRSEIQEMIAEMEEALGVMRGQDGARETHAYVMLWRRMMRLEEQINRHPY